LLTIEAVGGKSAGTILEGQKRFELQVRFDDSVRANRTASHLRISSSSSRGKRKE
jgi:Cu/Ag efflux pump CusA